MGCFSSIIIFVFVLIASVQVQAECTSENLKDIKDCYNNTLFKEYGAHDLYGLKRVFERLLENKISFHAACEAKKKLDSCLGDDQVCYLSSSQLPDSKEDPMFLTYLKLEYLCGPVYDIAYENHDCVFGALKHCNQIFYQYKSCSFNKLSFECVTQNVTEICGKAAGCFVNKLWSLENCGYKDVKDCGLCNYLNVKSGEGVCVDDIPNGGALIDATEDTNNNGQENMVTFGFLGLIIIAVAHILL